MCIHYIIETPIVSKSDWDSVDATPKISKTSVADVGATPSRWDITPANVNSNAVKGGRSRWDETPKASSSGGDDATPQARRSNWDAATPSGTVSLGDGVTPSSSKKKSRWDETPLAAGSATPMGGTTPSGGATPSGPMALGMMTPAFLGPMTPELAQRMRWEAEVDERNRPMSDEELDSIFPSVGYKILDMPAGYVPIRTPQRKLLATPTPLGIF